MILEIDELNFARYTPAQLAAVRPNLERLAAIMRRNLHLLDGVLGIEGGEATLHRNHEFARAQLAEARSQIETMRHDLATARAWIDQLQGRLAAIEDDEEDRLYRSVGLAATAHTVVVAAARRALLQHHHPDRWPPEKKAAATVNFQAVCAAFQKIKELRG
ncbi:molecular chaperone DnaJ [Methylorubrum extorquens]|uniref:molecular chaperone DnaJ n=1 Tax=Methylorubrum extorquens TaxID=408 RepID=UPI0022382BF5|nr:molecular chaperone DnaJ [Methylorubrum extorquens]UYW29498.1 molecular chaperone DnaJ [Methylorubrum extorquens]